MFDQSGSPTGSIIVFRDVTAARAMAERMTHSFEHDALTGLPNRLLLNDRIDQAIAMAPRHDRQVAVLFLDLDGFKHINDSLGHPTGDKLLQSIAKRLVGCVRSSDTVSRQGGDEFVVLLTDAGQWEDAVIVAERMLKAVAQAHPIENHDLHVTTSIGVSIYPDDGEDAETLIRNADTAMYQAKADGRHSYKFFKPAMNVRAVERQSIEASLREALKNDEFVLHYQPKIDLRTGSITGAEALIRWTHPTRGDLSPAQFVPIAEDSGLIREIGTWVLREACRQARSWLDEGLPPMTMAVNVSASELSDETYVQRLFATLSETGMEPEVLELELTESVLMKHAHSAAIILQALRRTGIQVALDDFGTGYSSLSYLRDFPIDSVKIDRSFVNEVTSVIEDTSIVKAVISMAQSLGLRVVAEGVENLDQLQFLRAHSCDEAQGFLFSRAVPPDEFAALLTSGNDPIAGWEMETSSASLTAGSEAV
jgi:diguanylate cyclase (GGDEF)-like protein